MRSNRRDFLKQSLAGLISTAGAGSVLTGLSLTNALAQSSGDYKALVCIFLYGGNDSFNMFLPSDTDQYSVYQESRRNLAVGREQLLAVNPIASDGSRYGFHPSMTAVKSLFDQGKVAVVGNVGPLIVPTSRADYRQSRVPIPARLFSHNDQQQFWQTLESDVRQVSGWAGRMSDAMYSVNSNRQLSMNIAMSGINLMQTGRSTAPYVLSPRGVVNPKAVSVETGYGRGLRRAAALEQLYSIETGNLLGNEYRRSMTHAMSVSRDTREVLLGVPDPTSPFPSSPLGSSLKMVARVIRAREQLGLSRQIFFVGFGGWDTHSEQGRRHPVLLKTLSEAMAAFYQSTNELGVTDNVATFTAADFGRSLTSNGDGSDHGWGGHQLVMGGAVNGNSIYGQMPEYRIEGGSDAGKGKIIPTTSVDQYGATLAQWYGLDQSNLNEVFPNLRNFNQTNLGFLG